MIGNLKVDIIYYKTSGDFELEFNLSGCCRMRIFKDNVDSAKVLVSALSRDVSRSRVILLVTDLIGEKNGAEILSAAIGYNYEDINKAAYSIKSSDEIKAPRGCLPLVTKQGQYGGFIIESGKQSIIVVSSDRTLRHEVMRLYIHQYIFDINQVELYNERLRHESENNPIIDNSNILNTARQELSGLPEEGEGITSVTSESGESVSVSAGKGVVLPTTNLDTDNRTSEQTIESERDLEKSEAQKFDSSAEETPSLESSTQDNNIEAEHSKNTAKVNFEAVESHSSGFVTHMSVFEDEDEQKEEKKINKRQRRPQKGTHIALLVISVLLLICCALLAYFLVYIPITGGEIPNDLQQILSEVFKWTE